MKSSLPLTIFSQGGRAGAVAHDVLRCQGGYKGINGDVINHTGWWFQPLWKILVKWNYCSQYMEKNKNVPNHQPDQTGGYHQCGRTGRWINSYRGPQSIDGQSWFGSPFLLAKPLLLVFFWDWNSEVGMDTCSCEIGRCSSQTFWGLPAKALEIMVDITYQIILINMNIS